MITLSRIARTATTCAWLFVVVHAALACSSGDSAANRSSDGGTTPRVEDGDRLFEGTLSTEGGEAGVCTLVIHSDRSAEGILVTRAGVTRLKGTGGLTRMQLGADPPSSCGWSPPTTSGTCSSTSVRCGDACCPASSPFRCAALGKCYRTQEGAAAACGSACLACGVTPPPGTSDDAGAPDAGTSFGGTLKGQIEDGVMTGTFVDAYGTGGIFSAQDATNAKVARFCGTFAGGETGTWNLQFAGQVASGSFQGDLVEGQLTGTVSGSSVSLSFSDDLGTGTATGTISGATISGTWRAGGTSGTWTGSEGACLTSPGAAPGGTSTTTSSGTTGSTGCCKSVERNGKTMTACCIEGCNADGSCRSGA